jgi:hypothetical protein
MTSKSQANHAYGVNGRRPECARSEGSSAKWELKGHGVCGVLGSELRNTGWACWTRVSGPIHRRAVATTKRLARTSFR